MPAAAKQPFSRRAMEPNLVRELRTHARVFGHMSLHGGLAAFLSGREPVLDVDANGNSSPTSEEDRKRVHRVLAHAFGTSDVGRAYYAHTLAVDAASMLRRMISPEARSTLCLDVVRSKLLAMRECMVTAANRPGEKVTVDPAIFEPAIQGTLAAKVCEYVRAEEEPKRVVAFVTAVRQTECDLASAFPDGFSKTFEVAMSLQKIDDPRSLTLSDAIAQLCDVHTRNAAIAAVSTLLDEVKLDHLWHAQMDQLEKDLETGEVVRYQDFVAKGHRLIQSGEWVRNPRSPQKKSMPRRHVDVRKAAVLKHTTNDNENSEPQTKKVPSNTLDCANPAEIVAVQTGKEFQIPRMSRAHSSPGGDSPVNNGHRQTSGIDGSKAGKVGSGLSSEDQSDVVKAVSRSRKVLPSPHSATKKNVAAEKDEVGASMNRSAYRRRRTSTPASWKLEAEEEIIPVRNQHSARRRRAPRYADPSPAIEGDESEITEVPLHQSSGKRRSEGSGKSPSRKRRRFTAPPDTQPEDSELEDLTEAQKYMLDVYTRGQGVGRGGLHWNAGRQPRYPSPLQVDSRGHARSKPSTRRQSSVLDVLPEDAMERYDLSLVVNNVPSSRRKKRASRRS